MNWLESFANALGMGVLAATAASQLFDYWRRHDAQQEQVQRLQRAAEASTSTQGEGEGLPPEWTPYAAFPGPGLEGRALEPADLQRLAQHLDVSELLALFVHPRLALGLSERDFTEADYEALLRLDDDVSTRQPVNEAQIAALPMHVHRVQGKRGAAEDGGLGTCSVCLDEFGDGVVVRTLPCLHHFHQQCVDPWLRQQGRSAPCPVCKTPVFQG